MSRRAKIFFTLSIMLNVLLLGVSGGMIVHKWQYMPFSKIKGEVSPESHNLIARSFQRAYRDMQADSDNLKKINLDLKTAMEAKEFDPEGFDKAMAQVAVLNDKMMERKVQMVKDLFAQLPQADRAKLSDRVIWSLSKRGKGHGDRRFNGGKHGDEQEKMGPQSRQEQ